MNVVQKMKPVLLAFSLLGLLVSPGGAAEKQTLPADSVGKDVEIVGTLGVPVGKVVTIKGRKTSSITVRNLFEVTSVDGKAAKLVVTVEGIEEWPDGTEAELVGSEEGTLKFLTLKMTNYGPNDPRWKGPYQTLSLTFKIEKIVSRSDSAKAK